jgi:excisionase family DNA binding protein
VTHDLITDGLMRVPEAARFLAVSRSKLYSLMDSGDLIFVKFGKSRRIAKTELLKLVERHVVSESHQKTEL